MRISITEIAEKDIEEGHGFYERKSPGLGSYFLDSIYSDIDSLLYYAGIHIKVFGYFRLLSKRFPFAVYYHIEDDVTIIKAVLDCRKNPSWIREKLMTIS